MNPSRTQLAEQLFEQSLELPEEERKTWLQDRCKQDDELYAEVCELFALQMEASDLFTGDEVPTPGASSPSLQLSAGSVLGDFEIEDEIGTGGMGIVFRAKQVSLKRTVALKVLLPQALNSASVRQRFQIEVEAAARLQHPNIIGVLTTGSEQALLYYAMDFVDGPSLADVITHLQEAPVPELESCRSNLSKTDAATKILADTLPQSHPENAAQTVVLGAPEETQPRDWRARIRMASGYFDWAATLLSEVASGVQFAHENNVLHRDIKPSNLMISQEGIARVGDFGLARDLTEPGITQTGEIIGTPYYMAPEQILSGSTVDRSADVYALGATLYETLTLQPPFPGSSRDQVLTSILQDELTAPRALNPRIPVDLETICLKALSKQPEERYGSAAELAADLQRFTRREPILAKRASVMDRGMKWIDRHRALAVSIAALPVCVAIVATIFAVRNHRLANELREETQRANESVFEARLGQAQATLGSNRPRRRSESLRSIQAAQDVLNGLSLPPEEMLAKRNALRNEAVAALAVAELTESRIWSVENPWTSEVEFSRDYKRYAQPTRDGKIRICQVDKPDQPTFLTGPSRPARQMKFSPDGKYLAAKHYVRGVLDGAKVYVWDLELDTAQPLLELTGRYVFVLDFDFNCSSNLFASVNPNGGLELYSLEDGSLRESLPFNLPNSGMISFSVNDRLAVAPFRGKQLEVWQIAPTSKRLESTILENGISAVAWSRTRNEIGVGTSNGEIHLWDEHLDEPPRVLRPHTSEIVEVHFQPNGTLLATRTLSERIAISDTASLVSRQLSQNDERVHLGAMGFSEDGTRIAFSRPKEFGYYSVDHPVLTVLSSDDQSKPVQQVRFHPIHPDLLARPVKDGIEFWDTRTCKIVGKTEAVFHMSIQISQDGNHLYGSSLDKGVSRWRLQIEHDAYGDYRVTFGPREVLYTTSCSMMRVSPSEKFLAISGRSEDKSSWTIHVLDIASESFVQSTEYEEKPSFLNFQGDTQLSVGVDKRLVQTWDLQSGELLEEPRFTIPADMWDFNPNHNLLAESSSGSVRFIDVETQTVDRAIELEDRRWRRIRLSPDGKLAVTTSKTSDPVLIEVETGQILASLESSSLIGVAHYEFSPDNSTLAVAGLRDVHLWRLDDLRQQLQHRGLAW